VHIRVWEVIPSYTRVWEVIPSYTRVWERMINTVNPGVGESDQHC